ncbi:MAG: hypothetical protein MUF62_05465 [Chitinophagaceae bacterium]|nr:hypothetical protein [Chitinophagaceae bacterium]
MHRPAFISFTIARLGSVLLLSATATAQNVGIGNTNPAFLLDVSGRMRIRSGASADSSAGIWLGGIQSSGEEAFLGVAKNQLVGFFGNYGAGWSFTYNTQTGTVGIGTDAATASLSLAQDGGSKIMLGRRSGATGEFGIGVANNELRFYMPTAVNDIQFGTGTNSSFTSMLRLSDLGTLVLGPGQHDKGGLVVDKKRGAVNAMFGSNTTGIAIESSFPGIGINTYFSDVRRAIGTGFGGYFGVDPIAGGMNFFVTDQSIVAGNTAPLLHAISIRPNGNVGIGTGASATERLEVQGIFRLRSSVAGVPASLQVATEAATAIGSVVLDAQGLGLNDGSGNRLIRLNTSNGALQLGRNNSAPVSSAVATSAANSIGGPFWQRPGGLIPSLFFNDRNNAPTVAAGGTAGWWAVPGAAYSLQLSQRYRVMVSGYFTAQAHDFCFLCPIAVGSVRLLLNGQIVSPSVTLGRLVASLGTGDETTVAGIQFDLAPGTHQLQWQLFNNGWWSRMTVEYWSIQLLPID